ncbi:hypothetical protein GALL_491310 [mine drainage metagenome]|uniref:Uncharacterized protein n=1 Tax=mine drainage metagenome TaxID=410659 RepID=A0A1J5PD58_9ZZZZ
MTVCGEGNGTGMDTAATDFGQDRQLSGIDCRCARQGDLGQEAGEVAHAATDEQGRLTGDTGQVDTAVTRIL